MHIGYIYIIKFKSERTKSVKYRKYIPTSLKSISYDDEDGEAKKAKPKVDKDVKVVADKKADAGGDAAPAADAAKKAADKKAE